MLLMDLWMYSSVQNRILTKMLLNNYKWLKKHCASNPIFDLEDQWSNNPGLPILYNVYKFYICTRYLGKPQWLGAFSWYHTCGYVFTRTITSLPGRQMKSCWCKAFMAVTLLIKASWYLWKALICFLCKSRPAAAPGGFLRFPETGQVRSRYSNRAVSTVFRVV